MKLILFTKFSSGIIFPPHCSRDSFIMNLNLSIFLSFMTNFWLLSD